MSKAMKGSVQHTEIEEDIVERLKLAYQTARQSPDHKGVFETPEGNGYIVLKMVKPPKKTKKELDAACKKIEALVKENARELKEQGLTVEDVFQNIPKIRAQLIKEKL